MFRAVNEAWKHRHVASQTNDIHPRGGRMSTPANFRQGRLVGPTLIHVASWRTRQRERDKAQS